MLILMRGTFSESREINASSACVRNHILREYLSSCHSYDNVCLRALELGQGIHSSFVGIHLSR